VQLVYSQIIFQPLCLSMEQFACSFIVKSKSVVLFIHTLRTIDLSNYTVLLVSLSNYHIVYTFVIVTTRVAHVVLYPSRVNHRVYRVHLLRRHCLSLHAFTEFLLNV